MTEAARAIYCLLDNRLISDCVPPGGVGAMDKWPAGATAECPAQAGFLSTTAATEVVTVAAPDRVGLRDAPSPRGPPR